MTDFVTLISVRLLSNDDLPKIRKEQKKWAIKHKNHKFCMKTCSTKTNKPLFVIKTNIKIGLYPIRKKVSRLITENRLTVDINKIKPPKFSQNKFIRCHKRH